MLQLLVLLVGEGGRGCVEAVGVVARTLGRCRSLYRSHACTIVLLLLLLLLLLLAGVVAGVVEFGRLVRVWGIGVHVNDACIVTGSPCSFCLSSFFS